jgi:transglutaminase-like putative cysteine protease
VLARTAAPRQPLRHVKVIHETIYKYEHPVDRSKHVLRLRPVQDEMQLLLDHQLSISTDGWRQEFEDVFGNHAIAMEIEAPYQEMRLRSESRVLVTTPEPLSVNYPARRATLPLVWMPWQRQMMQPYLLPPELPETQLRELSDFAMSFVERQDADLIAALIDVNLTIYRDFSYISGSTSLETTPWDVYADRKGVCQDFANLLIALARLLDVPARYRVGYIYTASDYENKVQSEASHAWAELYLPGLGWRGFDPTNGCIVSNDHIRVACGRNYRDATPTSGTIYKGGGRETLTVEVRVEVVEDDVKEPEAAAAAGGAAAPPACAEGGGATA